MNSNYHCTIKAIFYKIIFNYKLRFKYLDVANCYFTKIDIEKYIYDNGQDDFLIA